MAQQQQQQQQERISSLQLQSAGMPNGDYEAIMWLENFANAVGEDPAKVGATAEQSERISSLVKAFHEAYMVAKSPLSNTAINVRAKTVARNEAVKAVRDLANAIKANPEISDADKLNYGIDVHKRERERRNRARRERRAGFRPEVHQF